MTDSVSPSVPTPEPIGNHAGTNHRASGSRVGFPPVGGNPPEPATGRNRSEIRWAVYRPTLATPVYLGDVIAVDREAALRAGLLKFGGATVAVHQTPSRAASPALERELRKMARADRLRNRGPRR